MKLLQAGSLHVRIRRDASEQVRMLILQDDSVLIRYCYALYMYYMDRIPENQIVVIRNKEHMRKLQMYTHRLPVLSLV